MLNIYLTDLSAYNKGYLIGEWINLPNGNLGQVLNKILKSGEALCFLECGYYELHEEYFITDFEWEEVAIFSIGEYENLEELNSKLELLQDLSISEQKAVKFLLEQNFATDITDAISKVDDVLIHENSSLSDVAYDLINECYDIDKLPSIIANNIDYDSIARDLEIEGRFYEVDSDIYEYIG